MMLTKVLRPLSLPRRSLSSAALSLDIRGLTQDQLELRDMVEKFARAEIENRAADIDRLNQFPMDLWRKMGDFGLLGITVPEDFGGMGLGYLEHSLVIEELSRFSASVALSYGAHSNLHVNQLARNGTVEQKNRFLPKLISGEWIGSLAMSEHSAGSDVVSLKTRADRKGDRWILNGSKMWITNGPDADVTFSHFNADECSNKMSLACHCLCEN